MLSEKCPANLPEAVYCVFRPIVTDRFGNVTADFGIVTEAVQ
jgi:hypothetical protein